MRVALVMAKAQQDVLEKVFKGIGDNVNCDRYSSVSETITAAINRNLTYDRIFIMANLVPDENSWSVLFDYWSSQAMSTVIVIIGKIGRDDSSAYLFTDMFNSETLLYLLMGQMTSANIGKLVTETAQNLRKEYGVQASSTVAEAQGVEVPVATEESVSEQVEEPKQEEQNVEQIIAQAPDVQEQPQANKKKGGLFSRLFGKKETPPQPVQNIQEPVVEEPQNDIAQTEEISGSDVFDSPQDSSANDLFGDPSQSEGTENSQINPFDTEVNGSDTNMNGFEEIPSNSEGEDLFGFDSDSTGSGAFDTGSSSEADPFAATSTETTPDFDSDLFGAENSEPENNGSTEDVWSEIQNEEKEPETAEELDLFPTVSQPAVKEPIKNTVSMPAIEEVEEAPALDIDLSVSSVTNKEQDDVAQVEGLDLSGGSVADAESNYQKKYEAPKEIIKEVEKIVEVSSSDSKSILKSLAKGKKHATLIITGDRGSGITSTARLIGEKTSATGIDTLIVDLDTELHGFLSYINYDDYADCPDTIRNGLLSVRKADYIGNTIYELNKNLGVITTDYPLEVKDEDIERVQDIIEEVADSFGVIIIDCPLDKLPLITDLIGTGTVFFCVENTKRGFMNLLCRLESLDMPLKYKKRIASTGKLLLTKLVKGMAPEKVIKAVNNIYEADDVDWLRMNFMPFDGKLDNQSLSKILSA